MNEQQVFRYDLASFTEPRVILITDLVGSRRAVPRLGYVVLPQPKRAQFVTPPAATSEYRNDDDPAAPLHETGGQTDSEPLADEDVDTLSDAYTGWRARK